MNETLGALAEKKWPSEFKEDEVDMAIGLMHVAAGWFNQIKVGQLVEVNRANQWLRAHLVDDGLGKSKASVILENDETLSSVKVDVK